MVPNLDFRNIWIVCLRIKDMNVSNTATIWICKIKVYQDLLAEPHSQQGHKEMNRYNCVQGTRLEKNFNFDISVLLTVSGCSPHP